MHALTMKELQRFEVPARSLAVWWLGQMSFILKSPAGKIVAIDPYLSNSCRQAAMEGGFDMDRQTPWESISTCSRTPIKTISIPTRSGPIFRPAVEDHS
jgi:L-ascorbate 6-phosphate lactonase